MGSSQSSRRVNDEASAGDVARFLFLISTMNGRAESFMSVRRGERWTSPENSGERVRLGNGPLLHSFPVAPDAPPLTYQEEILPGFPLSALIRSHCLDSNRSSEEKSRPKPPVSA